MTWQAQLEVLGTVACAMLLGGLVGIDREIAKKPAGLRTLMLVAGASALIVSLGDALVTHYARSGLIPAPGPGGFVQEMIRSDPIRLIEAVVTGVSFLGAGTIIRGRGADQVEGLTTAAAILFVAAVGIAAALHQWTVAIGATALTLVALRLLKLVEGRFRQG